MSEAKSRIYRLSSGDHEPERSGLPSGKRGAGALRSMSPDLVWGAFNGGTLTHCPNAEKPGRHNATIATRSFLGIGGLDLHTEKRSATYGINSEETSVCGYGESVSVPKRLGTIFPLWRP